MAIHSPFGPSTLARVIACPASVGMCQRFPDFSSHAASSEGTKLHVIMETVITQAFAFAKPSKRGPVQLDLTPYLSSDFENRAYGVPDELHDSVLKAIRLLKEITDDALISWLRTELLVSLAKYDIPDVYGTADLVFLTSDDFNKPATLHVIDWKFGRVPVSVDGNPQLYAYALGALAKIGKNTMIDVVELCVIQPKINGVTTKKLSVGELFYWRDTVLRPAIRAAHSDTPSFNPGENQCRWCSALEHCTSAGEYRMMTLRKMKERRDEWKAANASRIHSKEEAAVHFRDVYELALEAEKIVKSVKGEAFTRCGHGVLPGYKIVRGRTKRQWKSPEAAIEFLERAGIDAFEAKLISVAQAEARGAKRVPGFTDTWEKKDDSLTLVPVADARQPVNIAEIRFAKFAEPEGGEEE